MSEENKKEENPQLAEDRLQTANATVSSNEPITNSKKISAIIHSKSEIKNMETHAQELHKAPGHGWKHYFFEFFMLFLAVFCGFLAENFREHITEHKRAKDYALALYKDLQRDTVDLTKGISVQELSARYIDSLCFFVKGPEAFEQSGKLFMYMRLSNILYSVDWNASTLNQLLNSGNLRYFTNHELTNKISEYNALSEAISNRDVDVTKHRLQERETWGKIFNAYDINNILQIPVRIRKNNPPATPQYDSLKNLQIPLVSKDLVVLNQYVMSAMTYKNVTNVLAGDLYPRAAKLAIEIMELLEKEYHLKENE